MKKITISLLTTAILGFANNITVEGFSSPESMITNSENLYVSNVGKELKPTQKDGDGFISKLTKDGKIEALHFIDGLNAPKGMGIVNNTLYVADIDTLRGFDLNTKKEVFSLLFNGISFLNDITIKDNNTLFIGASDKEAIYEVNIEEKSYKKLIDFTTANGLFYEDNILYAAQLGSSAKTMFDGKGKLFMIELDNNNKLTQLGTLQGVLDGVTKVGDNIFVSDWGNGKDTGIVRVYNLKTKKEDILKLEPFMGAADFWIDDNKLYLPQMIGGKISILNLPVL